MDDELVRETVEALKRVEIILRKWKIRELKRKLQGKRPRITPRFDAQGRPMLPLEDL